MQGRRIARTLTGVAALCAGAALIGGCVGLGGGTPPVSGYAYFAEPDPEDPWSPKIAGWQSRERATPAEQTPSTPSSVSGSVSGAAAAEPAHKTSETDLRSAYLEFRAERKRELARSTASWIQEQAQSHYVEDGPIDHWATFEGTLRRGGDDCDGLELLVNHTLRDLGFADDEIFRAVVYRPRDGQHHMVTFWFEDADDPWVIDPTGAMTSGMPRMSAVEGWVPVKVFSEDEEYTVRREEDLRPHLAGAPASRR